VHTRWLLIGKPIGLAVAFVLAVLTPSNAEELYGSPPNNIKEYLDSLERSYSGTISRHDEEFIY
jgi:hypothetical protein